MKWVELLEGTKLRNWRRFASTRFFLAQPLEANRWRCRVGNWVLAGTLDTDRWTLTESPERSLSLNLKPAVLPVALESGDVLLFESGLAMRWLEGSTASTTKLPEVWPYASEEERGVSADALLEAGDPFGEFLANPTEAARSQWLALLLLNPILGEVKASWRGAVLVGLAVHLNGQAQVRPVLEWMERLAGRLARLHACRTLETLQVTAPQFSVRTYAQAVEGLVLGVDSGGLPGLREISFGDRPHNGAPLSLRHVLSSQTRYPRDLEDRLRDACPKLQF